MDEKMKITILNLQKATFTNENTGVVNFMTKITYGLRLRRDENFVGFSLMNCFVKDDKLQSLESYIGKEVIATMQLRPTEKGVNYVITKLNDKDI